MNIINWTVRKSKIKRIDIPEGVTEIPSGQFERCNFLEYITIPDSVTSVGAAAFADCNENIFEVENGIKYIGKWVVDCYRKIDKANIREGTIGIAMCAISFCSDLRSITIPDSVTSIGYHAFYNCSGLTSIIVEQNNPIYHSADNCLIETANKILITGCKASVIPNDGSITSIGDGAFRYCSGLTSITLPDGVTSIGDSAFEECFDLINITIPDSIMSIGREAFYGCDSLTSITIPDSVTNIKTDAFEDCLALIIYCEAASKVHGWSRDWNSDNRPVVWDCNNNEKDNNGNIYYIADNGIRYSLNNGVATLIRNNTALNGKIIIPREIIYKDKTYFVTRIGHSIFCGCSGLTSIAIPDSVTSIGEYAFKDCSGLTSIIVERGNSIYHSAGNCLIETSSRTLIAGCKNSIIPDDGSVTSIGSCAFSGCSGLTSITIPASVTSIGDSAFSDCSGLTSITIPDSVTSIGYSAFSGCNGLASITIPDSVTSIGDRTFDDCSGLTSITIPDSVTSIGSYAFSGCSGLTSITIPDSVTSIGSSAFSYCNGLISITIADSVTGIGRCAFGRCSGLTSITIPDSVTSIEGWAFGGCDGLTDITYTGTKEQWGKIKKEEAWKDSDKKITITCADGVIVE